ncbi:alpha/beta hydrolase [Paludibacterium purpuratum]|uniref:Carboxylesterase n=1 Tax=Paludibacterium purpuratum TaxID=1144873 RepID=A0A4R7AZM4_9NEIS|nr:alpha/beta fold hydrolase [Paludibacterium purpuratum]TDR73891.1 carboxylesterase [Paludibacterium purpuratum]
MDTRQPLHIDTEQLGTTVDFIQLDGGPHAVLLLHGLAGSAFEVMHVAKSLNQQGYTVRIPILPGHRRTVADLAATTWHDWYAAAEKHFETLSASHQRVSVSGLCMGSLLSLQLAARKRHRVASVVAMSTTLAYDGSSIPWYSFLLPLVLYTPLKHLWSYKEGGNFGIKHKGMRKRMSAKMGEKSRVAYNRTPADSIREMRGLMRSTRNCLGQITAPTLILHAREDNVASPRNADYLERHLGSTHIEKIILDDCYHVITVDKQKSLVACEAGRFIAERAQAATSPSIEVALPIGVPKPAEHSIPGFFPAVAPRMRMA